MVPAACESGVTILRFPAGSWGDTNDIRDGSQTQADMWLLDPEYKAEDKSLIELASPITILA